MSTTWNRTTGIAALVSLIMALAVLATWGNPQPNGPLGAITGYYVDHAVTAQANVDLTLLSLLPSLLFGTGLVMLVWSQGKHVLALLSFASVIIVAALTTIFTAANMALIAFAGQASGSELRLLMTSTYALDSMQFFVTGFWVGVTSVALLRSAVFSRWVCGIGILAALLMLFAIMVPMTSDLTNVGMLGLLLFMVWLVVIGISLLWHPVRGGAAQGAPILATS